MAEHSEIVHVGNRDITITRPAKVLFPDDGITKSDLVEYYQRISAWILPHLKDRPLSLERYPDGIEQSRLIQQAAPQYFPPWIKTAMVKKISGGTVTHVISNDQATLAYLATQACVTPHAWLSRMDKVDFPDQMVFDLDPSGDDFEAVKSTAQALRHRLQELAMPAYVKTSGSRGLHVVVPLKRDMDFDSVRSFARQVAEDVVADDPEHRTVKTLKSKRRGRIYLDTNRNAYAQTVAPAYAVRARRGAPVSVPIGWGELDAEGLRPDGVTIRNLFARLDKIDDPWTGFWRKAVSLAKVSRQIKEDHAA
jgi:bifunctional non-homologous end joining protein LigD